MLAQAIESVASNWSGGKVGTGTLARGHSDVTPLATLPADVTDPCFGTGNPGCADPSSPDFVQRRTHTLPNGAVIWDVAGNVGERVAWTAPGSTPFTGTFAGKLSGVLKAAIGPSGTYSVPGSWDVAQLSETYVYLDTGSFAVVDGKNFWPGKIWVRAGAVLFVRGSNYQADLAIEANGALINWGSNIYGSAKEFSSKTLVDGSVQTSVIKEQSTANCGGVCPVAVTTYLTDPGLGRGLGWVHVYSGGGDLLRGGHFGYGPMAGVFGAMTSINSKYAGFRCVREICELDADCNDGDPCSTDTCATGACKHANNTKPCQDGNACTVNDTCSSGVCTAGTTKSCNDFELCTNDSCNTATGCINAIKTCNDSKVCTADSCDPKTGACVFTPIDLQAGACAPVANADPKWCGDTSIPSDLGSMKKQVFSGTGVDQSFVVPAGVTQIRVKLWGAGGGSYTGDLTHGRGGGGGFSYAELPVTAGETLTVVVGKPGGSAFLTWTNGLTIYGGAGYGGLYSGDGAGRSALRRGTSELVTAGAGGGAGGCDGLSGNGGGGGWPGGNGTDTPPNDTTYGLSGTGATAQCGGKGGDLKGYALTCPTQQGAGSGGFALTGGSTIKSAAGQGGGGGGWFGGGSGGGDGGGCTGGGGGGGSCWADPAQGCVISAVNWNAAAATDAHYRAGVAAGGSAGGKGADGAVVVFW